MGPPRAVVDRLNAALNRALDVPEEVRMQLCIGTSLAIIVPTTIRREVMDIMEGARSAPEPGKGRGKGRRQLVQVLRHVLAHAPRDGRGGREAGEARRRLPRVRGDECAPGVRAAGTIGWWRSRASAAGCVRAAAGGG